MVEVAIAIVSLRLANAGAQVPCPNVRHVADGLPRTDDVCPNCTERGWVYGLSDAVRVPCNRLRADLAPCPPECPSGSEAHLHSGPGHHEIPCRRCKNRGWVPSEDGWLWWRAVAQLASLSFVQSLPSSSYAGFVVRIQEGYAEYNDPELAYHSALNKALEARGAKFPLGTTKFGLKCQTVQS